MESYHLNEVLVSQVYHPPLWGIIPLSLTRSIVQIPIEREARIPTVTS